MAASSDSTAGVRAPRAMAWVLLAASAVAILVVGVVATLYILGDSGSLGSIRPAFWTALVLGSALTVVSLTLRSLRWIFLLRRAGTRIPIRDAYIGYFAGLSLLLTPFLMGEIAIRAFVHRARARVPVATTVVVNLWDRVLDLMALAVIAGSFGVLRGGSQRGISIALLTLAAISLLPFVRQLLLTGVTMVARSLAGRFDAGAIGEVAGLASTATWLTALAASVGAWLLPGLALWGLAETGGGRFGVSDAALAYSWSAALGGLVLAPGGVVVTGRFLLDVLLAAGFAANAAAMIVLGIRFATAGVATALGVVFLFVHLRSRADDAAHFDAIADVYDVQIPESRRLALLARKTEMMRDVLSARRSPAGVVGLDVGCGQGQHVGRMRELGFDVSGIDVSPAQVEIAAHKLGLSDLVRVGTVTEIPARDGTYDFAYIVNVLHHLDSIDEQRRAMNELLRVLKPGGTLFIHEINTRNLLFRFYMGYVYPSLNCIDEGVERWLLPHRLELYTDAPVEQVRYFTFLPEFLPAFVVRLLTPLERALEASPLRTYSAHYLAVLRKA